MNNNDKTSSSIPLELFGHVTCGDCVQIMREQLPDNCIDLTVTSPPYDDLRDYKGHSFDFRSVADQIIRVTKKGGVVVWVVGDATHNGSETGTSFRQAMYFMDNGLKLYDTMIYNKNGFRFPDKRRYSQVFEFMFVFSKGWPTTFCPIMDRKVLWTQPRKTTTKREKDGSYTTRGGQRGSRKYAKRFNIWTYSAGYRKTAKEKIVFTHPAVFPEKLAQDHIYSWSREGDVILDPMSGSGTVGKMAKIMKRRFIGFEIASEYVDIANRRIFAATESLPNIYANSETQSKGSANMYQQIALPIIDNNKTEL